MLAGLPLIAILALPVLATVRPANEPGAAGGEAKADAKTARRAGETSRIAQERIHRAERLEREAARLLARAARRGNPDLVADRADAEAARSYQTQAQRLRNEARAVVAQAEQRVADPIQLSPEQVRMVQRRLILLGAYQGEPTGRVDARTRDGIRVIQMASELEPTGNLDAGTLMILGVDPDEARAVRGEDEDDASLLEDTLDRDAAKEGELSSPR